MTFLAMKYQNSNQVKRRDLYLEKVNIQNQDHINDLYKFICLMKFPISNIKKPSLAEHLEFVKKNPYREWFIVKKNSEKIGTLYLTFENSIGLNLISDNINDYKEAIIFILSKYKPTNQKKSVYSSSFHVNINPSNTLLEKALIELDSSFVQKTYLLKLI